MDAHSRYRRLPEREDHYCFGCSPINPSGLRMKFYTDEEVVFSWIRVPEHFCGWDSLIHGGILSTMLDEIMSWTAIHLLRKFTMTKSITVDFLRPVHVEKDLELRGRVHQIKSEREVLIEGFLYDEMGRLCTKATGTFALFTREVAMRMGIMDAAMAEQVERIITG